MKKPNEPSFTIVGLGLIGGSLCGALRRRFPRARIAGFSRSLEKIRAAKNKKWIHDGTTNLAAAVKQGGMIFICTPVDSIVKLLHEIDRFARKGTIVTDVGSTKEEIVKETDRIRFRGIQFVGSHPLAGSHLTGIEHANPDLFCGAWIFVTPSRHTSRAAAKRIVSVWKKLGGKVKIISPETHDQIVSEISHLPHAVASLLVKITSPRSLRYAAGGFRDTTRIAQGEPSLWLPIFISNRPNLASHLDRFIREARLFSRYLKTESRKDIVQVLKAASRKRGNLRSKL